MTRQEEAIEKALDAHEANNLELVSEHKAMEDAIAAYEAHMRPDVATLDEAEALPVGSAVRTAGGVVYLHGPGGWVGCDGTTWLTPGWQYPLTVIHWGQP